MRHPDNESDRLIVHGGYALSGAVTVSGFKHVLVTIVGAAVGYRGQIVIRNVPDILESAVLRALVGELGARSTIFNRTWTFDGAQIEHGQLDQALSAQIHGSVYLLPALLARFGTASVAINGGCQIGNANSGQRPVRHYAEVLRMFGAGVEVSESALRAKSAGLVGCRLDLSTYVTEAAPEGNLYSGATKFALLCALYAEGKTELVYPYSKPDVTELAMQSRTLGASVTGADIFNVEPIPKRDRYDQAEFRVTDDLMEIVTWIVAGALFAADTLTIRCSGLNEAAYALKSELAVFRQMGVPIELSGDALVVHRTDRVAPINLVVDHVDSVFSDSQPFIALLATAAHGTSTIDDKVWPNRYGYASGLNTLGCDVEVNDGKLIINGPCLPNRAGQVLVATDLRAAACILLAALAVPGRSHIYAGRHLQRGYKDLSKDLEEVGAKISLSSSALVLDDYDAD